MSAVRDEWDDQLKTIEKKQLLKSPLNTAGGCAVSTELFNRSMHSNLR